MWANRTAYRQTFPEMADEYFASRQAPPCIVVYVDAWTAYGGSQFVDSPGTGYYHTYLCEDVVGWVDSNYRTLAGPEHRGIHGKSSGGFGAMITPMLRPDLFGGFATHAGDSLYEYCYITDFGKAVRHPAGLRRVDRPVVVGFPQPGRLHQTGRREPPDDSGYLRLLLGRPRRHPAPAVRPPRRGIGPGCLGAVARLGPGAHGRPAMRMPYGASGPSGSTAAPATSGFSRSEARRSATRLGAIGITDLHFELFEGAHGRIEYRYPMALAYLAERLSPQARDRPSGR